MIRHYHVSDRKEICRVFNGSKPCELAAGGVSESFVPLEKDERRIVDFSSSAVFVWEEDGKVSGFVGSNGSYIGWLFVDPNRFREGIGRILLRHLMAHTAGDPWLWAMKDNQPAIALYLSEGFDVVDERLSQNGGMPCVAVKLLHRRKAPNPII